MKQLLILSGKGGTGKTTIAAAFIQLSHAPAFADCDVDAPNLHLVFDLKTDPKESDYYGLKKAVINTNMCIACDLCRQYCRFGAISSQEDRFEVNPFACEGCGVCAFVCPQSAISMEPDVAGALKLYKNKDNVFSTATLKMGSGTTGLLVSEVKKQLKEAAPEALFSIIDGSPGIGCPVIASLSGADMVLIVAEPSVSGMHDMKRILKTAQAFGPDLAVCINKYDTHPEMTEKIEAYCQEEKITCVGRIPFDPEVVEANNSGQTLAYIDSPAARAINEIYKKVMGQMMSEQKGGCK